MNALHALVSCADDGAVDVVRIDGESGHAEPAGRCAVGERVMPMARRGGTVWAATRGSQSTLARLSWDAAAGRLSLTQRLPVQGSFAGLAIDPRGRWLFGASYGQDRVVAHAMSDLDGGQAEPRQVIEGMTHAHAVVLDAGGRFAYASALGDGVLRVFEVADSMQAPPLREIQRVALGEGFGPRHLRLSPDGRQLLVLGELSGTVAFCARDAARGTLELRGFSPRSPALEALLPGVVRPAAGPPPVDAATLACMTWAADLHVHPDGRFAYFSERTSSTIVVLRREGDAMVPCGAVPTEARPRGFAIDPGGHWLVACGERSTRLAVYRLDPATGLPEPAGHCAVGRGANWIELL